MRKETVILIAGFVFFTAINCMAASGLGGYVTGGGGISNKYYGGFPSISMMGGGFLYDTNVDKEGFNYRLNLGVDRYWERLFDNTSYSSGVSVINKKHFLTTYNIKANNNFGFGLYSSDTVRLWFGPQLAIAAGFREGFNYFSISAGPVIGLNYHLTESVSLSFEAAFDVSYLMRKIMHYEFDLTGFSQMGGLAILDGYPVPFFFYYFNIAPLSGKQMIHNAGYTGQISFSFIYKLGS
ncbi:MAG: hypothetical protein MUD12_01505 [Spirochaetes bacterium]|jgi:hypothetical protein|nr:hypothetical protein [Spirochaetota bacterium]